MPNQQHQSTEAKPSCGNAWIKVQEPSQMKPTCAFMENTNFTESHVGVDFSQKMANFPENVMAVK